MPETKKKQRIRCEMSKEAINLNFKQRRGYVIKNSGEFLYVQWDGNKSFTRYARILIHVDPLLELVSGSKEIKSKYPMDLPNGKWIYIDKKGVNIYTENSQEKFSLLEIIEKLTPEQLVSLTTPPTGDK